LNAIARAIHGQLIADQDLAAEVAGRIAEQQLPDKSAFPHIVFDVFLNVESTQDMDQAADADAFEVDRVQVATVNLTVRTAKRTTTQIKQVAGLTIKALVGINGRHTIGGVEILISGARVDTVDRAEWDNETETNSLMLTCEMYVSRVR